MESILKIPDLWKNLKTSPYPIVLYGMGNGADKIIDVLNKNGISFVGVFASDNFKKSGKTFHGFPVLTLSDLEQTYEKLTVLMCFGSARQEVIENVKRIKKKHLFYAPDVPVCGDIIFDNSFFKTNYLRHKKILNILADEISKNTFANIVSYKLSGNIDFLFSCETSVKSAFSEVLRLNENEIYLDLGAYRGDTVFEFIKYAKNYRKIYAVEPDKKSYLKLKSATENLQNIETINACISSETGMGSFNMSGSRGSNACSCGTPVKTVCADDIIGDGEVTYIKADIEGAECDFIKGAENIIKTQKPKMMISCYHRSDDLINIPEAVLNIRNDYKVYMRHFPSLPAWDTVYLFV